jgi:hypothetical protein
MYKFQLAMRQKRRYAHSMIDDNVLLTGAKSQACYFCSYKKAHASANFHTEFCSLTKAHTNAH